MRRKDAYILFALWIDVCIVLFYEAFGSGLPFEMFIDSTKPIGMLYLLTNLFLMIQGVIFIYTNRFSIKKFMGAQ